MIQSLKELAFSNKLNHGVKKLVVVSANDEYVLEAVNKIYELGLIAPIFIGNSDEIQSIITRHQFKLPANEIINEPDENSAAQLAVEMVKNKQADILMKGLLPTRTFIKAIVDKQNGIVDKNKLSHLAIFESPHYHKLLAVTDAAMNISPSLTLKIKIIQNAVRAFHTLGFKSPKVSLIAAVEKVNPKMKATTDAAKITEQHKINPIENCIIEGPLSLDISISKTAAKHKGIENTVAGDADILVVPEITSGNVLYKSLTYLGRAKTAGILLGASVPVVLTSRADTAESKFYSIALGYQLCK